MGLGILKSVQDGLVLGVEGDTAKRRGGEIDHRVPAEKLACVSASYVFPPLQKDTTSHRLDFDIFSISQCRQKACSSSSLSLTLACT